MGRVIKDEAKEAGGQARGYTGQVPCPGARRRRKPNCQLAPATCTTAALLCAGNMPEDIKPAFYAVARGRHPGVYTSWYVVWSPHSQ